MDSEKEENLKRELVELQVLAEELRCEIKRMDAKYEEVLKKINKAKYDEQQCVLREHLEREVKRQHGSRGRSQNPPFA